MQACLYITAFNCLLFSKTWLLFSAMLIYSLFVYQMFIDLCFFIGIRVYIIYGVYSPINVCMYVDCDYCILFTYRKHDAFASVNLFGLISPSVSLEVFTLYLFKASNIQISRLLTIKLTCHLLVLRYFLLNMLEFLGIKKLK